MNDLLFYSWISDEGRALFLLENDVDRRTNKRKHRYDKTHPLYQVQGVIILEQDKVQEAADRLGVEVTKYHKREGQGEVAALEPLYADQELADEDEAGIESDRHPRNAEEEVRASVGACKADKYSNEQV